MPSSRGWQCPIWEGKVQEEMTLFLWEGFLEEEVGMVEQYLSFGRRGECGLCVCVRERERERTLPVDHSMHLLSDPMDAEDCKVKLS